MKNIISILFTVLLVTNITFAQQNANKTIGAIHRESEEINNLIPEDAIIEVLAEGCQWFLDFGGEVFGGTIISPEGGRTGLPLRFTRRGFRGSRRIWLPPGPEESPLRRPLCRLPPWQEGSEY